jgi:hypothetical protein
MAAASAPPSRLEAVLSETDAAALEIEDAGRAVFTSFGSCSWREPVDELRALGMLP